MKKIKNRIVWFIIPTNAIGCLCLSSAVDTEMPGIKEYNGCGNIIVGSATAYCTLNTAYFLTITLMEMAPPY